MFFICTPPVRDYRGLSKSESALSGCCTPGHESTNSIDLLTTLITL